MKTTQIAEILNEIIKETTGQESVVKEDLSNVVEVGTEFIDSTNVDNYVKSLINRIGRVIFVNRPYSGRAPSLRMDGWEYGSIMEKIDADIPDAVENESWKLTNGTTYNQDEFNGPKGVTAKFFNGQTTFEVDFSFADEQVRESFSSAAQLNAFFSMIYTKIDTRFTIDIDNLIMRTLNYFTAVTLNESFPTGNYGDGSTARAVNLLYEYKQAFPDSTLTAETCLKNLDFIKFASLQLKLYSDRLTDANRIFNIGKKLRFTPKNLQGLIMLSEFIGTANVYLQSDTFHNELTKLPEAETVNFWQGCGTKYEFSETSKINVVVKPYSDASTTVNVVADGILAILKDHDSCGVNNYDRKINTHRNGKGDFINSFYKMRAQYFIDTNENYVVFYIADPTPAPEPTPVG